jgi:predicted RNase H-like HicB family nuclease
MKDTEIEVLSVLSRETNNWVVRLPNRQHPGVVIQGDSLKILYDLADEIHELAGDREELRDVAEELRDQLRGRLEVYEKAVRDHGLGLPYSRPVT